MSAMAFAAGRSEASYFQQRFERSHTLSGINMPSLWTVDMVILQLHIWRPRTQ
jgi:hypothetical protein